MCPLFYLRPFLRVRQNLISREGARLGDSQVYGNAFQNRVVRDYVIFSEPCSWKNSIRAACFQEKVGASHSTCFDVLYV